LVTMLSWSTSGIERENANQEFKEFRMSQIARLQAKASAGQSNVAMGPWLSPEAPELL
jgi:hypothetical protein